MEMVDKKMIYNKTQKFKVINTKIIYYNEIDVLKHVYRFIIIIKKNLKCESS